MPAISPVTNVESMHRHLSGLLFLDRFHLFMEIIYLFGMLITTTTHLFLILRHLEDGKLPGQNNLKELQLYVQWELTKIMYQMPESNINLKCK